MVLLYPNLLILFDELRCYDQSHINGAHYNVEVSNWYIAALILLTLSFKCSWHIIAILRGSLPEVFCKKGVLEHFAKFIGKQLCRSLFFYKIAGRLQKKFQPMCFLIKFAKKAVFFKFHQIHRKTQVLECLFDKLKASVLHLYQKETSTQVFFSVNFARFFRTLILHNICERLFLILVRIGLVQRAANISMFFIIDCMSVFQVLRCSFQLILH